MMKLILCIFVLTIVVSIKYIKLTIIFSFLIILFELIFYFKVDTALSNQAYDECEKQLGISNNFN